MVGISFEHLYADPLLLVVRPDHPLLKAATADASQIRHYPAILPSKGTFIRHLADTFAVEQGIGSPAKSIETLSVSFGRTYTNQSDAVWLVPWSAVANDLRSGFLMKLPLPTTLNTASTAQRMRPVGLMSRTDDLPAAKAQVLINVIKEVAFSGDLQNLAYL